MAQGQIDPDQFTAPFQLTKGLHRDVYPAIDPKNERLKASGKVVVITGAGGGLGYVSYHLSIHRLACWRLMVYCTGNRPSLVFGRCGRGCPRWPDGEYAGFGRQIARGAIAGGHGQCGFRERRQVNHRPRSGQVRESGRSHQRRWVHERRGYDRQG